MILQSILLCLSSATVIAAQATFAATTFSVRDLQEQLQARDFEVDELLRRHNDYYHLDEFLFSCRSLDDLWDIVHISSLRRRGEHFSSIAPEVQNGVTVPVKVRVPVKIKIKHDK